MEQPIATEQPSKKTADMNAYMRDYMKQYRLKNLEKCKEQHRQQYHRHKPTTEEEKMKRAEKMVLKTLEKYPELFK
jgi:hypothetical protein